IVERPPREAEPRLPVSEVGMAQADGQARLLRRHDWRRTDTQSKIRVGSARVLRDDPPLREISIEIGKLPGLVIKRRIDFVTQTHGERQIGPDLPVVLNKTTAVMSERFTFRTILGDADPFRTAE